MMHENSLEAFHSLDKETRRRKILEVFKARGPMTDRLVCLNLGFSEMNAVRPRITEMVKDNILEEITKTKDAITGRTVRVCQIMDDNPQMSLL